LIGLSTALRTAIPIHNMLMEMKGLGFNILNDDPVIKCEIFEDNNGALTIASVPRMRPRTKHINTRYFHFMEYTSRKDSPYQFSKVDTLDQVADMLTKPLSLDALVKFRKRLLGW
jgi:hypothetical protein